MYIPMIISTIYILVVMVKLGLKLEKQTKMNKYLVIIEEILSRTVEIEGDMTENEALKIVKKRYENEEIVLDSNDFTEYNITVSKNKIAF